MAETINPMVYNLTREDLVIRTYFAEPGIANKMGALLDKELYTDPMNKEIIKVIRQFIKKYKRRPSSQEIITGLESVGYSENVRQKLMMICNNSVAEMKNDFAINMIESFYQEKKFEQILLKQAESLHDKNLDYVKSLMPMCKDALNFSMHLNLGLDVQRDAGEALRRLRLSTECIPSGVEEVRTYTNQSIDIDPETGSPRKLDAGGYHRKTLSLFVGQPNVGKSLTLCSEAAYAARSGYNVLYVTLELAEEYVWQRLAANLMDIPQSLVLGKSAEECEEMIACANLDGIEKLGTIKVKHMPTTCTPDEIENLLDEFMTETKEQVDLLVIDYIGIMKPNRSGASETSIYADGVAKAEQIREICIIRNMAGLSAVQFGRSGYKRLDAGMESVADSVGYNNTSDLMITITCDSVLRQCNMFSNTIIKNRFGPNDVGFISKNDFAKMRWFSVTADDYADYEQKRAEQAVTEATMAPLGSQPRPQQAPVNAPKPVVPAPIVPKDKVDAPPQPRQMAQFVGSK